MKPAQNLDLERVLEAAIRACPMGARGIHGVSHWLRVERIALAIAERSGADVTVVRLFARLHDCRRENDGHDPCTGVEPPSSRLGSGRIR